VIAVVGDVLVDVYVLGDLVHEEQTEGLLLRPGGSAANTAAWVASLGTDVVFAGCVADDACGAMLTRDIESFGVRARTRTVRRMETGAVLVSLRRGERVMRSSRGANTSLSPDDIVRVTEDAPSLLHLTGYALLGPYGAQILEAASTAARASGAILSFDPSSVGVIEYFGGQRLLDLCARAGVEVLLPNRVEAAALTGERRALEAAAQLSTVVAAAVVKNGARGSVYSSRGQTDRIATAAARPVDTTGAGDAFNAGVLVTLEQGGGLEIACRSGNEAAGKAIRHLGGRPPR